MDAGRGYEEGRWADVDRMGVVNRKGRRKAQTGQRRKTIARGLSLSISRLVSSSKPVSFVIIRPLQHQEHHSLRVSLPPSCSLISSDARIEPDLFLNPPFAQQLTLSGRALPGQFRGSGPYTEGVTCQSNVDNQQANGGDSLFEADARYRGLGIGRCAPTECLQYTSLLFTFFCSIFCRRSVWSDGSYYPHSFLSISPAVFAAAAAQLQVERVADSFSSPNTASCSKSGAGWCGTSPFRRSG
jgi:hypothetical protein